MERGPGSDDNTQDQEPEAGAEKGEPEPDTVLLQDLAPRKDVKGGAGKRRFGELGALDDDA